MKDPGVDEYGLLVREIVLRYLDYKFGEEGVPEDLVNYQGYDKEACRRVGDYVRERFVGKNYAPYDPEKGFGPY